MPLADLVLEALPSMIAESPVVQNGRGQGLLVIYKTIFLRIVFLIDFQIFGKFLTFSTTGEFLLAI